MSRKRGWVKNWRVRRDDNRTVISKDVGNVIGVAGLWGAFLAQVTLFVTVLGLLLGLLEEAAPWLSLLGWGLLVSAILTLAWHLVHSTEGAVEDETGGPTGTSAG